MCNYIKDDGEQCGREQEPFCHQHKDTRFAALWTKVESSQSPQNGSQSDSVGIEMGRTCSDCNGSLRRTERLQGHPNYPKRMYFLAVVECDCSEYVLGKTSELKMNLPDGWSLD